MSGPYCSKHVFYGVKGCKVLSQIVNMDRKNVGSAISGLHSLANMFKDELFGHQVTIPGARYRLIGFGPKVLLARGLPQLAQPSRVHYQFSPAMSCQVVGAAFTREVGLGDPGGPVFDWRQAGMKSHRVCERFSCRIRFFFSSILSSAKVLVNDHGNEQWAVSCVFSAYTSASCCELQLRNITQPSLSMSRTSITETTVWQVNKMRSKVNELVKFFKQHPVETLAPIKGCKPLIDQDHGDLLGDLIDYAEMKFSVTAGCARIQSSFRDSEKHDLFVTCVRSSTANHLGTITSRTFWIRSKFIRVFLTASRGLTESLARLSLS